MLSPIGPKLWVRGLLQPLLILPGGNTSIITAHSTIQAWQASIKTDLCSRELFSRSWSHVDSANAQKWLQNHRVSLLQVQFNVVSPPTSIATSITFDSGATNHSQCTWPQRAWKRSKFAQHVYCTVQGQPGWYKIKKHYETWSDHEFSFGMIGPKV